MSNAIYNFIFAGISINLPGSLDDIDKFGLESINDRGSRLSYDKLTLQQRIFYKHVISDPVYRRSCGFPADKLFEIVMAIRILSDWRTAINALLQKLLND